MAGEPRQEAEWQGDDWVRRSWSQAWANRKPHKKTLGAISEHKPRVIKRELAGRLSDVKPGHLRVPESVDVAEHLVQREVVETAETKTPSMSFVKAQQACIDQAAPRHAATSLETEKVHPRYFARLLDGRARNDIAEITTAEIDRCLTQR